MANALPTASAADTVRIVGDVLLPLVAQGAIVRRPWVSRLADRVRADDRALRRVRALRTTYGEGPLLVKLAHRNVALVLGPADVRRILANTPEPFSAATREKAGALRHFQPHAVLVTDPPLRAPRRALNEQALDTHQPVHRHGDKMLSAITDEFGTLNGTFGWDDFREIWSRLVRRVVLGDRARDDTEVTRLLDKLRADANWAEFHRRDTRTRRRFRQLIDQYVGDAEPGSLVGDLPPADDLDPAGQVPHWLFAFDAAGIAVWRLLAVLATRPDEALRIAEEARHPDRSPLLAYAGAAVQESLRLWPTTLVVLREGREDTDWDGRTAPAGTEFAIISSVFHRDDEALDFANHFEPTIWLDGRSDGSWPLIPFSAGPAVCPGRNVVLLTTSAVTGQLVARHQLDVDPATRRKLTGTTLPTTFDHTSIRLGFWRTES
jgi:cytochrome P450